MKCFVTGASGFIGSNLVQELLARGHRVKALVRAGADERGLQGLKFERVTGDVFDRQLLGQEMAGCDWCFHVAGSYHLWLRHYAPMMRTNVEGTRNVLEAAGKAGCQKIVYTSTAGCIGLPAPQPNHVTLANETEKATADQLFGAYKQSKFQAEAVAVELFRKAGLPVIIVNPTMPIGPGDARPTPTGQFIVDFLNGRLPAYLDAGMNWVHIHDVVVGHILAAERGRFGERYILGNQAGNWTMRQAWAELEKITGLPAPQKELPLWLAEKVAEFDEALAFFTGRPPRAPLAAVRMARRKMWFDSGKAIRELGLPQTPPEHAFADAVAWYRANGYVKRK